MTLFTSLTSVLACIWTMKALLIRDPFQRFPGIRCLAACSLLPTKLENSPKLSAISEGPYQIEAMRKSSMLARLGAEPRNPYFRGHVQDQETHAQK